MDGRAPAPSLRQLRRDIAQLDHLFVRLVAARMRLARLAIETRRARGAGTTDAAQERRVRLRARQWAREAELSAELVDGLFRAVIEAGKAVGESLDRHDVSLASEPKAVRVALAGTIVARHRSATAHLETVLRSIQRDELASDQVGDGPP